MMRSSGRAIPLLRELLEADISAGSRMPTAEAEAAARLPDFSSQVVKAPGLGRERAGRQRSRLGAAARGCPPGLLKGARDGQAAYVKTNSTPGLMSGAPCKSFEQMWPVHGSSIGVFVWDSLQLTCGRNRRHHRITPCVVWLSGALKG